MKKILFAAGLLLCGLSAKAQWSSMTIVNHSTCAYSVRLGADFKGVLPCAYTTDRIVVPGTGSGGSTISYPNYWSWAVFNNFVLPTTASPIPSPPSSWIPPGTADVYGTAGCFEWRIAEIWPADAIPGIPGGFGGNTPHPCGPTYMAGDAGACGPIVPGPHVWTKNPLTGDVVLDLY